MDYSRRQPGKAAQSSRFIQIALQRRNLLLAQTGDPFGRRSQCKALNVRRQQISRAQADIATADNQHALTAKTRRQRAKRSLV